MIKKEQNLKVSLETVDSICGSGKSYSLKLHIDSTFNTINKTAPRILLVMPTHKLTEQFQLDLNGLKIKNHRIITEKGQSATVELKSALDDGFLCPVVLCTHECFKHYCYKAAFDNEMQRLLSDVNIYVDEIPQAFFGAYNKVKHSDVIKENFPFLNWLEEKENGLLYLKETNRDAMKKYWYEDQANGNELKQMLWAMLQGAGLLYDQDKDNKKNTHLFSFTASPILYAAQWSESFTLLGAGANRSEFIWVAENVLDYSVRSAEEHLQPELSRRVHKSVPVRIVSLLEKDASLSQLANVVNNHLLEVKRMVGDDFIFATNRDKSICDFETVSDSAFGDMQGSCRVSMASYGLNNYQHIHKAVFLGCANHNGDMIGKWKQYAELNGWDSETLQSKKKAAMNYELCYQFLARTSIRNSTSSESQLYIVPDMATANYLKEHYFKNATIENLELDRPRKESKKYETKKGKKTDDKILAYCNQGLKPKQIADELGMSYGTVRNALSRLQKAA